MKIPNVGSSMKQLAYARRVWGAKGTDKKSIALDVGYSPSVASSVVSKIESRKGFHNAIAKLAADSNNLALAAMHEFKARGFDDFSNKDLVAALNAIAGAWDKFNKGFKESLTPPEDNGKNRLKTVILQNIAKQTNITAPLPGEVKTETVHEAEFSEETSAGGEEKLDF